LGHLVVGFSPPIPGKSRDLQNHLSIQYRGLVCGFKQPEYEVDNLLPSSEEKNSWNFADASWHGVGERINFALIQL
jgi:hypothetical protein